MAPPVCARIYAGTWKSKKKRNRIKVTYGLWDRLFWFSWYWIWSHCFETWKGAGAVAHLKPRELAWSCKRNCYRWIHMSSRYGTNGENQKDDAKPSSCSILHQTNSPLRQHCAGDYTVHTENHDKCPYRLGTHLANYRFFLDIVNFFLNSGKHEQISKNLVVPFVIKKERSCLFLHKFCRTHRSNWFCMVHKQFRFQFEP